VRVAEGIEALIPQSEFPQGVELHVGDLVKAEIMNLDGVDRRITMSLRNVGGSALAEQVQALNREKQAGRPATLWRSVARKAWRQALEHRARVR